MRTAVRVAPTASNASQRPSSTRQSAASHSIDRRVSLALARPDPVAQLHGTAPKSDKVIPDCLWRVVSLSERLPWVAGFGVRG